jgi:hypothetical protein
MEKPATLSRAAKNSKSTSQVKPSKSIEEN